MPDSENRIAVVTGGAQGIGGTTAATLAAAGYTVHSLDLKPNPSELIQSHICDVTDEARLLELAEEIGAIDALLCGAGINLRPKDSRPEQIDISAWRKTLDVNLTGTMLTVRAFRPKMRMEGAIVTMGSVFDVIMAQVKGGDVLIPTTEHVDEFITFVHDHDLFQAPDFPTDLFALQDAQKGLPPGRQHDLLSLPRELILQFNANPNISLGGGYRNYAGFSAAAIRNKFGVGW